MTAAASATVRHVQHGCHRMRPPLGGCLNPRARLLAVTASFVLGGGPTCSVDTAKLRKDEIAEMEKIAEREYSLHQVKL